MRGAHTSHEPIHTDQQPSHPRNPQHDRQAPSVNRLFTLSFRFQMLEQASLLCQIVNPAASTPPHVPQHPCDNQTHVMSTRSPPEGVTSACVPPVQQRIGKPIAGAEHGKLCATMMHYVASGGLWRSQSAQLPAQGAHLHHVIGGGRCSGPLFVPFRWTVREVSAANNHMRCVSHRKQNVRLTDWRLA